VPAQSFHPSLELRKSYNNNNYQKQMSKDYPASYKEAEKIFRQNSGILRASEAKALGIPETILSRMLEDGLLVKEARGLYRLADLILGEPDLVQVSKLVPKSVVCLISALSFHNLTTQIPKKVYVALPRETKAPRLDYPPLDIIYLSEGPYQAGIEEHELDGVPVRIYDKEKTIADCFKFRNKIGLDIAIEALKDYLSLRSIDLDKLAEYAKINRVKSVITPYIKASL
jgi:predicted transcriptional regulator of viral defense system